MFVRPHALDSPDGPRPQPRAGTIGDAEIHRHADQGHVKRLKHLGPQAVLDETGVQKGRRVGEGPFAAVAVLEYARRHGAEVRIFHLPACSAAEALSQVFQKIPVNGQGRLPRY
ncbi:hypothetical protein LZK75_23460 [Rhizobium leguminosarum]|nr:hypothetical protein LZK75_23460 [Rhizobium leguminosarum]